MNDEKKDPTPEDMKATDPADPEEEAFLARVETFTSIIGEVVLIKANESITKEKTFSADLFVGLVSGGMETLRHYIEDPEEKAVTWEDPWVESHYTVKWGWEMGGGVHYVDPNLPKDVIDALRKGADPKKLAASPEVRKVMVEALAASYFPLTLQALTHHVAAHVKGGETVGHFFLEPHLKDELDALPTQEARNARMEELLKPFSIGGVEVEDESGASKVMVPFAEPADVDAADASELHAWYEKETAKLPKIFFSGEVRGTPYKGSVVLMVHNLVVDEDRREAYFPIVTGLSFVPADVRPKVLDLTAADQDFVAWDPSTWNDEERATLWKSLDEGLEKHVRKELQVPEEATETPEKVPASVHVITADDESIHFFDTDEMDAAGLAPTVTLEPVGALSPERRATVGVAFGHTRASTGAMEIIKDAHKVTLPKKWSSLKRWEDLVKDEVRDIQKKARKRQEEEEKKRAAAGLEPVPVDNEERTLYLRRVTNEDGEETVTLTDAGMKNLRRRAALGKGYIDVNPYGQECWTRLKEIGRGGFLEWGLSWQGLAGPLVDEWRKECKRQAEELGQETENNLTLFKELDAEKKKTVDKLFSRLTLWEDGRGMMDAIIGQVGKQGRNPVEIPAETFRVLLWPEKARTRDWPQDWKRRVEGALVALHALTFTLRTHGVRREDRVKAYGSFVGQWAYKPIIREGREEGVYVITVGSYFLGCLQVFQAGKIQLRSGGEADVFFFTKALTKDERKSLGWVKGEKATDTFVTFDAGTVFYNKAAGLTATQRNLVHFIEKSITLRKDTARKENRTSQVPKNEKDAGLPRLYGTTFCPFLPSGVAFVGALGRFKRNPEAGFTLWGSESRAARHPGGLLFQMGHVLPSGSSRSKAEVIKKALEDIKAVVVEYLEGIVAGHIKGEWTPLENFGTLDERTLTRGLRLFFFLPENYEAKRRERFEETTGRRVTEDPAEAELETWEGVVDKPLGSAIASEENFFRGWPLPLRLRAMMKKRGLRQKDLAPIFGVSAPVITYWLKGVERGDDGRVLGKPIPKDVEPLVLRWVETGNPPTMEELAAQKAKREKRPGRRGRLKKN